MPDGRVLVQYANGTIEVSGLSNRVPEAAVLGYRPPRVPPARVASVRPPLPAPPPDPWDVADRLLESLLDDQQRRDRLRYRRWWVEVDRGWVQLGGSPHAIRFRPREAPTKEWSLCVVTADPTLPPGDVWTTLLLTATASPDTFFGVANWSRPVGPTPPPPLRQSAEAVDEQRARRLAR